MFRIFAWRFMLTPIGVANVYYPDPGIGYTHLYFFGILVARIQRTYPWIAPAQVIPVQPSKRGRR
jgi:hypothetical protein